MEIPMMTDFERYFDLLMVNSKIKKSNKEIQLVLNGSLSAKIALTKLYDLIKKDRKLSKVFSEKLLTYK